ncbi:MAG: TetR/AcrR family transcriptional regulator [Actinobacteria bacterium]|nr:TetR/AcrR family transcriptional regulator [Actinomycetota bacterium]
MTTTSRLPAAERRQALVETAIRVFAEGSYRGTTTAEIARAAGVSEPILYRHFASKRDLFLAALDHVWAQARDAWKDAPTWAPDHQLVVRQSKFLLAELWAQALTEAADDAAVRQHLHDHLQNVHDFVAAAIRQGQEAGVIQPDRDPEAEGWLFIAGGLLGMLGRRIGLPTDDDLTRVRQSRLAWMRTAKP